MDLLSSECKCSVIVTAYNQAATISQTIDSILSQQCNFAFEIIIGDDHSEDGTDKICQAYKNLNPGIISYYFQPENIGVAANFASVVQKAKGKYIAICAGDDYWHHPSKLQMQVDFLDHHPDYGLVYSDYDKLNVRSGKIIKNYLQSSNIKLYEGSGLVEAFFKGKVPALTLTIMFRKVIMDKFVPLDDYIKFRFPSEDWITWLIISRYSKIGCLPVSTSTYRFGHESLSNILNYSDAEKRYEKEHFMYKYLCDLFPDEVKYNKDNYLIYSNGIFLNLAYRKFDYQSAKNYSKVIESLGSHNLKVLFARHKITFFFFASLKYIKTKFRQ